MEPKLASDLTQFALYGFSLGTALYWFGYCARAFYTFSKR